MQALSRLVHLLVYLFVLIVLLVGSKDVYAYQSIAPSSSGQSHWYSILLKGNGDVDVHMRVAFTNHNASPVNSIELYQSRYHTEKVEAYQLIDTTYCPPGEERSARDSISPKSKLCVHQDGAIGSVLSDTISVLKVGFTQAGNRIILHLAKPVLPQGHGSVIIFDKSVESSSTDIFGAFHTAFSSLISSDPIDTITLGISLEDGYHFKKSDSGIQYQVLGINSDVSVKTSEQSTTSTFDNANLLAQARSIGLGTIMYSAHNLAANESFSIFGIYAKHWSQLYGKELMLGILFLVGFVIVLVSMVHRLSHPLYTAHRAIHSLTQRKSHVLIALTTIGSITGVVVVLALEYVFILHTSYNNQGVKALFIFLSFICVTIICAVFLCAPVLYIGLKRGVWQAAAALCGSIGFLAILCICALGYVLIFF